MPQDGAHTQRKSTRAERPTRPNRSTRAPAPPARAPVSPNRTGATRPPTFSNTAGLNQTPEQPTEARAPARRPAPPADIASPAENPPAQEGALGSANQGAPEPAQEALSDEGVRILGRDIASGDQNDDLSDVTAPPETGINSEGNAVAEAEEAVEVATSGEGPAANIGGSEDAEGGSDQDEDAATSGEGGAATTGTDSAGEDAASDDQSASGEEATAGVSATTARAGPQGDATQSALAGELSGIPAQVASGQHPIPLTVDNAATLNNLVDANASQTRDTAESYAQNMLANSLVYSQQLIGQVDQSAIDTIATFRLHADDVITGIEAETEARIGSVFEMEAVTAGQIDAMVDTSLQIYEDAYQLASDDVAAAIEAKASAIETYGITKAREVRDAATTRIERARAMRDEAYAPYRNHEDKSDVREAVDGVFDKAEERYRDGGNGAASEIVLFANAAAATWRSVIPPENAQLIQVHGDANTALEAERTLLKDHLGNETNDLIASLEIARDEAIAGVNVVVAAFDAQVELARQDAQIAITEAVTALTESQAETTTLFSSEVDALQSAMSAEIARLDNDTGGLFSPDNARPGIEQGFSALSIAWVARCDETMFLFLDKCDQAQLNFTGNLATAEYNAVASLMEESDRFQVAADQVMSDAIFANSQALDLAQIQLMNAEALVLLDLSTAAETITGALDTAYDETVANIDKTAFDLNADHNGSLYELRAVYGDAITEALKAWYEKLFDWVIDLIVTIVTGFVDFVVWVGKTIVNIVWGFIWGEAVFPEAWGAGVIVFVADVVAGVLIYGDVRDLFKWGFWRPVVMGEEWTWLNTAMIGLSLVGLIPAYGDIVKILGKGGVKAFVKELGERVARELLEEFGEEIGEEVVERLVRELGGDTVRRLTEELGARGVRELVEGFTEKGLKELIDELGEATAIRLARELGADGLSAASNAFGNTLVRNLASEFAEGSLKELIDELGEQAIKDMAEHVGAQGLRDLVDNFTAAGLKELTDGAAGLTARAVGELAQDLTAAGLKRLVDDLTLPVVRELADATTGLGTRTLSELVQAIPRADFLALVRRVHSAGLRQMVSDMGADRLARAIATDGWANFSRAFARQTDPMAIAARAATYSARILGESFDVARRFGDNTATFSIGADGVVNRAVATLSDAGGGLTRSSAETTAQRAAVTQAGDQGGHMIAHRFMGDNNLLNMFSQFANLNTSAYKKVENEIAEWIQHGAQVRMTVELIGAAGERPSAIQVGWDIFNEAGDLVLSRGASFLNEAGQTFDRIYGPEIAARLATSG